MSELQKLLKRLAEQGEEVQTGAQRPFFLDDAESMWVVLEGNVEVFSAWVTPEGNAIDRRHVLSAQAGDIVVGMGRPEAGGIVLLGVATPGSVLRRVPYLRLRTLAAVPAHSHRAARLLDHWLSALCEGVVGHTRAGNARELAPGKQEVLAVGGCVMAGQGVVWAKHQAGASHLMGDPEFPVISGEDPFPLAGRLWLEAKDPVRLAGIDTLSYLLQDFSLTALDRFHHVILQCIALMRRRERDAELARLRDKAEANRSAVATAIERLSGVMTEQREEPRPEKGEQPLLAVCRLLCQHLGVKAPVLPRLTGRERDPLARIAESVGLRHRQVALRGEWWHGDYGPMVAYLEEGKQPVALLPTGPTRYELWDPRSGGRARVNARVAQTLSPFAHAFYRRLPAHPLKARDLIRFGAFGVTWDVVTIVGLGVAGGVIGMLTPQATATLFDTIIPGAQRAQLVHVVLGLLIAAVSTSLFELARGFAILRAEGRVSASLQAAVWDRLLDLPADFFRDYNSGDLAMRSFGIETIQRSLSATTLSALMGMVFAVFNAYQLFSFAPHLATYAIGLVFFSVLVTVLSGARQLQLQRPLAARQGRISGLVLQFLFGIAKLRVAGAEGRAFAVWAREFAEQRRLALKTRAPLAVFNATFPILASLVIYYMVGRPPAPDGPPAPPMTTGSFTGFISAFGAFMSATLSTCGASLTVLAIMPIYERIRPILETRPEVELGKADPGVLTGEIEVAHVAFRYRADGPQVLNDVSLRIQPGEFLAVVGGSGSGKSTLLRLLLGFEKPQEGSIYYNGQDMANLDLRAVRRQIGVVLQNGKLLTGDILSNIIGTATLTPQDALEAARMAGFDKDLEQMPMGLHTVVSEGGGTLSGGQRQRLMIARALVRKPRILFFDEATSALDNRTQAIVKASVDKLAATRVVIAHRLSTIMNADRIVVMQGGRVVQVGTYAELMAQEGPFAELARRQIV